MSRRYDAVVIGAGHNGLTAALLLARAGRRVLVLERREAPGGLCAGEEFHPGYRTAGVLHDTGAVRPWVIRDLELDKHGLELLAEPPPIYVPREGDRGLLLWREPERAAAELEARASGDGARYRDLRSFLARVGPLLRRLLDRPPPDVVGLAGADLRKVAALGLRLRLLGRSDMLELLRVAPMCVADFLDERFAGGLLKAALAGPAVYGAFTGPWSPGSTVNLLLAEAVAAAPVRGGGGGLTRALSRAAAAAGVEVRTGAPVERVVVERGRARGVAGVDGEVIEAAAVLASCDPKRLFLGLLEPGLLDLELQTNVLHYRCRGTAAQVDLAVSAYPRWAGRPELETGRIRTGEHLDELERAFDAVKYGQYSQRPVLDVVVPTVDDPSLAPSGHHVLSLHVHCAPYEHDGGAPPSWRDELLQRAIETLARYAPGFESTVVAARIQTPADLEARYGATGGHLFHGEHSLDQLLVRPVPECAAYRTPFAGLYLCGSGAHPGGGVTCVPGALAARTVLRS